ncbi:AI-2E family transporter [Patescibacteria group bacterium]|nr:AI-2E family transporter [Patescibacteria group bacterium]
MGTTLYGLRGFIIISLVYYLIQWTENNVLIPTLMKKSLGVSPLVVFLCMLVA